MRLTLDPGSTVRFILDSETLTGSPLPTLSTGVISDLRPIVPCALRQIIPVTIRTVAEETRLVWISDDQILTVSAHPSGGLP